MRRCLPSGSPRRPDVAGTLRVRAAPGARRLLLFHGIAGRVVARILDRLGAAAPVR